MNRDRKARRDALKRRQEAQGAGNRTLTRRGLVLLGSQLAFGAVLDLAGADHIWGWGLAFAAMGAGVIMGPLALALLGARPKTN